MAANIEEPDDDPYETECPLCGCGPLYQDRVDALTDVAHCDDCGEEIPGDQYRAITDRRLDADKA
jgi:uncharacterized protein (DUF983 family)